MNNQLIKKSFIRSLFHVCTLKTLSHIIHCDDNNIIYINNIEEFKQIILPTYFHNIKLISFTRHLNSYKFSIQTIHIKNIKIKKFYNKLFNINDISCIDVLINKYHKKNRQICLTKNNNNFKKYINEIKDDLISMPLNMKNVDNHYLDMKTYDIKKYISNINTTELISMPADMKNMLKSMEILIKHIDNIDMMDIIDLQLPNDIDQIFDNEINFLNIETIPNNILNLETEFRNSNNLVDKLYKDIQEDSLYIDNIDQLIYEYYK